MRFIALFAAALACSFTVTPASAQNIQVVRNGGRAQTVYQAGRRVYVCRTSPATRIRFSNTQLTINGPGGICRPREEWHLSIDMSLCDYIPIGSNFRGSVIKTCR